MRRVAVVSGTDLLYPAHCSILAFSSVDAIRFLAGGFCGLATGFMGLSVIHHHSSRATLQALLKMFHSRNTDPLPTSLSRMSRHAAKWEEFRSRK